VKKNTVASPVLDTAKINKWKDKYDSLYDKYSRLNEIKYINQAGVFADSILLFEQQLLNDSVQQKTYFHILFNRSLDLNDLQNYITSRELLEKYITLSENNNKPIAENLAYAKATLANIYSRFGDYKKSAILFEQSISYYITSRKEEDIASCNINIAIYLKEFRKYDDAVQVLNKNFMLKKLRSKRKAISCIELADIYTRQDKLPEAGLQIEKAKSLLNIPPFEDDFPSIYSSLFKVQGTWLLVNHKPAEALKAYQQSFDSANIAFKQSLRNRDIGKLYIAMGNAFEEMQLYDSALQYYNWALYTVTDIDTTNKLSLPLQKDIYAENTIAEALYARAGCIIKSGTENEQQLENAVGCYKLAFETEKKLLNAFSYDESRQFMLEQTRRQTEKAITLCYRLYQNTKNSRWANEAFLFAEHNKAFVLSESIKRNTAASLFLQKDSAYKKTQALQNNLAWIEIELSKLHFSGNTDTALIQSLTRNKQKTEEELLSAENSIRLKNPQYSSQLTAEKNFTAEEILNKTLSTGNRLIEYFTGDSSAYIFSAEKNKPLGFYRLAADLKNSTTGFLHFFTDRNLILQDPAGYAAAANKLYQSLLGPYTATGNSPMLVVPDGFISFIPFDALLTRSATSTDIASFPFLIKQQETYYAFSCYTLLEQQQNKNMVGENVMAAFAPAFSNKERGLTPLLYSKEEVDAIKQSYPKGLFFKSANATLNSFITNSSSAGIIHLATHAGSGDSTTFAGIEFYDSTLYLNRIYSMRLNARLVVLSGCETGTGAVNKTEGLMSLARGFSYAGTKNVIGSLWQTEDKTSAEIFKKFYSNLADNNFSTALHKAKLAVIGNSSVAAASPYFWSGYIYIGTPSEGAGKQVSGKQKLILLISGAVLLLLIASFLFLKRRKVNQAVS
jgi:CHAT domain-containing protein